MRRLANAFLEDGCSEPRLFHFLAQSMIEAGVHLGLPRCLIEFTAACGARVLVHGPRHDPTRVTSADRSGDHWTITTEGPQGPLAVTVTAVDGVPLIEDASQWRDGKGLLFSTARSFKGLEADVVILCDFSGLGSLFTISDLYVALTRARSHLVIVAHDRATKETLDVALAAAIATGSDE